MSSAGFPIGEGKHAVTAGGARLFLIAGPCVIESRDSALRHADRLRAIAEQKKIGLVYKSSYDKANRTSHKSFRGIGRDEGLAILAEVRSASGLPVLTDVHESTEVPEVAEVVDVLQIPAFLCRQTDLIVAAAASGKTVNIKKGQFLAPWDMEHVLAKARTAGGKRVMVTERGTTFGYGRLINDFIGLGDLMELPPTGDRRTTDGGASGSVPVCFDCTHSTQTPGTGEQTGGRPERAPLLARAAVAAGVHALFLECHPEPSRGLSDASTMLRLDSVQALLRQVAAVRAAVTPAGQGG